jgi:hypothetical protein
MLEADLYRSLYGDCKGLMTVRIEKLAGAGFKSGLPDFMFITQYGNFLIELKRLPPSLLLGAAYKPAQLLTTQQRFALEKVWNINKSAFVWVGWENAKTHNKLLSLIPISAIETPITTSEWDLIRGRGEKWPLLNMAYWCKQRSETR